MGERQQPVSVGELAGGGRASAVLRCAGATAEGQVSQTCAGIGQRHDFQSFRATLGVPSASYSLPNSCRCVHAVTG